MDLNLFSQRATGETRASNNWKKHRSLSTRINRFENIPPFFSPMGGGSSRTLWQIIRKEKFLGACFHLKSFLPSPHLPASLGFAESSPHSANTTRSIYLKSMGLFFCRNTDKCGCWTDTAAIFVHMYERDSGIQPH